MTTDRPMCKYQSDCYIPKADMVCVYPALDNVTKLLQVFHGRKPPLLFLGHPLDLHYSGRWGFYLLLENQALEGRGIGNHMYHMNYRYKHVLFWTKFSFLVNCRTSARTWWVVVSVTGLHLATISERWIKKKRPNKVPNRGKCFFALMIFGLTSMYWSWKTFGTDKVVYLNDFFSQDMHTTFWYLLCFVLQWCWVTMFLNLP